MKVIIVASFMAGGCAAVIVWRKIGHGSTFDRFQRRADTPIRAQAGAIAATLLRRPAVEPTHER